MINRVRGTQDHLDTSLLTFFIETATHHLSLHNFTYIETPILEQTKLFLHALGEHTDVVSKEMYTFDQDGEESICLRPEFTASTIRAYGENSLTARPWKVFSHGPAFRRERPQKGRWRQFSQFNIELINTPYVMHDSLLIAMLNHLFLEKFKIDTAVLKLNYLGSPEDRKNHREKLLTYLGQYENKMCPTCLKRKEVNTLRIFDCKNSDCQKLYDNAPNIIDCLSEQSAQEWKQVTTMLELMSVSFIIDKKLVRGLDYYNRTVFEFTSAELGAQNAFCGGGRYTLGKQTNGRQDYDSVGAAIGIGRVLMLLESRQDLLMLKKDQALHVILPLGPKQKQLGLLLLQQLTAQGIAADIILDEASMTNLMKKANRLAPSFVLLIGEDEQKEGVVMIKNMMSGKSEKVRQEDLINFLL